MSNNCLVTRLKAVVNDDSLPIIETMNQFTLNAIAASGNNNMTDAQKWALNHFFYRIGAISNSGIYSKLQVLGLSFIGISLNTALHNYIVGGCNPTRIDSRVSFSNGTMVSTIESGDLSACEYSISGKDNKAFQLISGVLDFRSNVLEADRVYKAAYDGNNNYAVLSCIPYTQFSSAAMHRFNKEVGTMNIIAFNASSNNIKLCYATSDGNTGINIPSTCHIEELLGGDATKYIPLIAPGSQMKGFACGFGLTDEEALTFTQAYSTLIQAFNS